MEELIFQRLKGRDPLEKKRFLSRIARITYPPPDLNSGNLVLFFPDLKIQDLKVTLGEGREIY